jgi:NAD(P)-dependent dehydrogenase (short-subunit alcohol dehydrogenase family)
VILHLCRCRANDVQGVASPGSCTNGTYSYIDSATNSDLSGRCVFITGATKGVSKAMAIAYAKAGAAQIAIGARSDLTSAEEEMNAAAKSTGRSTPPKILRLQLNVQDRTSITEAAMKTREAFGGKLDIPINNSGYLAKFIPVL